MKRKIYLLAAVSALAVSYAAGYSDGSSRAIMRIAEVIDAIQRDTATEDEKDGFRKLVMLGNKLGETKRFA